jgi:TonB family protein
MNTMITEAPASTTRLGVGFDANRGQTQNRDAWKRSIGTKQVPARLAMLPEGESRWQRLGVSAIVQIIIVAFFVALPIFFPERLKTALNLQVVPLSMPVTEVPVAPPPPPPKAKVAPTPKPVIEEPKLNPKQPHIFVQQKVLPPKVQKEDAKAPDIVPPKPVLEAKFIDNTNQPKRPREEVKVNNLNAGSAAVPTVNLPVNKVQTGGFGDPNGLPGKGDTNKTANVNRLGSPALPGGPGYGNGTGGDKGVKGVVASTGFGNGVANPPQGGGKQGVVQKSGFGDQTVVAEAPKKKASADSATSQVDILSKPRPEYTAEGRALKLEGDVVVDVVFQANGKVEVSRVVSGLGHGLDESAVRAAQQIQFKPAKRDGEAVDFPARVRIEFRLAY